MLVITPQLFGRLFFVILSESEESYATIKLANYPSFTCQLYKILHCVQNDKRAFLIFRTPMVITPTLVVEHICGHFIKK